DLGFDQGGDVAGSLALNGVQVPIVGVADAGFGGLEPPPADVWIFLSTAARLPGVSHIVDNRSSQFGWSVIGQRRPGVSDQRLDQGLARAALVLERADRRPDVTFRASRASLLSPRAGTSRPRVQPPPTILLALAGGVLATATADAGGIQPSPANVRRAEPAIRVAQDQH